MKKAKEAPKKLKFNKKYLSLASFIILLAAILFYFKGQFVVALVNNRPIWRTTLIKKLEDQAGKQVLDSLITKTLILQEAKKQGVKISQEEIDEEIRKLEESLSQQGQELDKLLKIQGVTRADLEEQIRIQKSVDKIVGTDIEVKEEEIDEYLKQNEKLIPKEADPEQVREDVRAQLRQQKLNEKIETWLTSLQEKAEIKHFLFVK